MRARLAIQMTFLVFLLASNSLFADPDQGKVLYEESCTKCHGTEVFTRDDRSIKSLEGLKSRVKQCSQAAESQWGDEEINIVVDYLDKNFYKF